MPNEFVIKNGFTSQGVVLKHLLEKIEQLEQEIRLLKDR